MTKTIYACLVEQYAIVLAGDDVVHLTGRYVFFLSVNHHRSVFLWAALFAEDLHVTAYGPLSLWLSVEKKDICEFWLGPYSVASGEHSDDVCLPDWLTFPVSEQRRLLTGCQ